MKQILQTVTSSGSGYGISYWKGWMGCSMKAYLADQQPREPKKQTKKHFVVGSTLHAFMELYYGLPAAKAKLLDTTAVRFVDDAGDPLDEAEEGYLEGERLFRAYRAVFSPSELGQVVGVEELLKGPKVEAAVDCSPFTIKPDLIVKLSRAMVPKVAKTRQLRRSELSPGYWLVDHKTASEREWTTQMFLSEVQFTAYMLGYQASYPRREVKGMLVNIISKAKRPEFRMLAIPFPKKREIAVLSSFLQQAQERRLHALEGLRVQADITRCFYPEPCGFLNVCKRGAE